MNKIIRFSMGLCAVVLMVACKNAKFIYLKDMPVDMAVPISYKMPTRIKPGDRLAIQVNCTKQELAVPFNSISYKVSADGQTQAANNAAPDGYLVDDSGYIEFPILGRLQVSDLTLPQVSEYIKGLLIEGHYIPDAIVETRITNFTIYGLGGLAPGKLVVPEGQINILQAVSQMGDLRANAKYQKVRVIREDDGQRMEFDVDMTTTDLYDSPAFYLQQNDIVYAEPKRRPRDVVSNVTTWISSILIIATLATTIVSILK